MTKSERAFLVGVHRYCFRAGEKCRVASVEYFRPSPEKEYRLCYKVVYDDGATDYIALSDAGSGNYKWVPELEANLNMLPAVTR